MKEKTNIGLRSISWEDARKHAEQEGKAESTTNTFGIENPYYHKNNLKKKTKRFKKTLEQMKHMMNHQNTMIYKLF